MLLDATDLTTILPPSLAKGLKTRDRNHTGINSSRRHFQCVVRGSRCCPVSHIIHTYHSRSVSQGWSISHLSRVASALATSGRAQSMVMARAPDTKQESNTSSRAVMQVYLAPI
jgi:hypothetical protein